MTYRASNKSWRLDGEPGKTTTSTWDFMTKVLEATGLKVTKGNRQELSRSIFWPALGLLRDSGLIYEAVTLMVGDQAVVTIRLNDFHASTGAGAAGELELIKDLPGSGYYVNKANNLEEPEGCWFFWPEDPTKLSLKGVYRLRFRCATPETAKGLERDEGTIDHARDVLTAQGTLQVP